jgi:glycosyltransferase involved in cell wall biosynthesis
MRELGTLMHCILTGSIYNKCMTFSIIIATFNRSQFLKLLLLSILNQKAASFEIIVINDGGSDNTAEVIESFNDNRIRYYRIENAERGAARNTGVGYAKGEYVNFFDSDDLFLPCLHKLEKFIRKNNTPDVIYGSIQHVDEKGNEIEVSALPYKSFTKNLLHNNFLACGSVFIKREIARRFPFHEDRRLSSAEDWELWLRVHTQYSFIVFRELIFQQVHHSQRSLQVINPEKIEIRDNYFASLVSNNTSFRNYYCKKAVDLFVADRFSYIALAWCENNRNKAFFYWSKALGASFRVVIRKRFWAIFKKLVLR